MAIYPGDIISHAEMCIEEAVSLQKGMNFRIKAGTSVMQDVITKRSSLCRQS